MTAFSSSLPLTKCAKATSHLRRIHRRSALQGTAKAQGYALCLSPEAHWAKKEHLRQCLAHVTRLPRQGCRHRSPTCPWKSMRTRQNRHSQRCTQAHKKPPHARQRKPMRKAAKRKDCPNGWAWLKYKIRV